MRTTSWLNFAIHSEHLLPFWTLSSGSIVCVCVWRCRSFAPLHGWNMLQIC